MFKTRESNLRIVFYGRNASFVQSRIQTYLSYSDTKVGKPSHLKGSNFRLSGVYLFVFCIINDFNDKQIRLSCSFSVALLEQLPHCCILC